MISTTAVPAAPALSIDSPYVFVPLSLALVVLGDISEDPFQISDYMISQYHFNYETEFLKRGFVGELFRLLDVTPTFRNVWIFSMGVALTFVCALFVWLQRAAVHLGGPDREILFLVVLCSPAVMLQLGSQIGRLDWVNYAMLLVAILAIRPHPRLSHFVLPIVVVASVLTHEAFVFLHFGLLFAIVAYEIATRGTFSWAFLGLLVGVAATTELAILLWGSADVTSAQQLIDRVSSSGIEITSRIGAAVSVVSRTFEDNLAMTAEALGKRSRQISLIFSTLIFGLYAGLLIPSLRACVERQARRAPLVTCLLLAGPFAALPMFVLGTDFTRWTALMIVNLLLVWTYAMWDGVAASRTGPLLNPRLVPAVLLLGVLGPLGEGKVYPILRIVIRGVKQQF